MLTRIQHFAIVSENFVREAKFYEAVFAMKRSKPGSEEEQKAIRTNYAVSISDGYVGVTVIGRKPGYVPGLHHFGVDVDDVDEAMSRIKKNYPEVAVLERPSNRPFATYGAHDPEGNYFDLTQEGRSNRRDVYVEQQREQVQHAFDTSGGRRHEDRSYGRHRPAARVLRASCGVDANLRAKRSGAPRARRGS